MNKISNEAKVNQASGASRFSILALRNELQKELNCNFHAVPAIEKVVVSVCLSKFISDSKKMEQIKQQLMNITGRLPMVTKARKSVASFKIRQGMHLGYKITLRKKAAEDFLFMLIYMTLPRVTDFRGLSTTAFDGRGNYNLGLKKSDVFMQVNHDLETNFGMNITICTTSKSDDLAKKLLEKAKLPLSLK